MTRVALVHPFSWPDVRRGAERYLHDLAWWLGTQGVAVDVVVGGRPGIERVGPTRIVRVRHPHRLDVNRLARLDTFAVPALTWLARHRYDVVHALTPTAALASVVTGHRTVYTVLGHPTHASLSHRRWDEPLLRTAVRRVRAPLALSASAAQSVRNVTGVMPGIVPPGVRIDRFPFNPAPRAGPPRVLFPSYAGDRRKGLDLLLHAFGEVLASHPDARLQLGGGGDTEWAFTRLPADERSAVGAACDDLGVGDLGELPGRYAAATVTVLPSTDEAFGLVLVESLATGTPVVALASGGPTEIVDRPEVGRLVEPANVAALAAAIRATIALAGRPGTAHACHQHARLWDWETAVGPRHLEVYRRVRRRRDQR